MSIENTEVKEKIGFDPVGINSIEDKVVSEIGLITLDNIEPQETDPYPLSSIYPSILNLPNESTFNIPFFNLEPTTNNFSFSDFSEAAFNSGSLSITIINNLVVPLNDVEVKLKKSDGSEIRVE